MSIVNSHNEWDKLEEVIVGHVEDSIFPEHHISLLGGTPQRMYNLMRFLGGLPRKPDRFFLKQAREELEELVKILEAEGVKVRRPNRIKHHKRVKTPNWKSRGHTLACPRDCFLVIGDEIIEAPMSWRNRYFEREAYYEIFKEYFDQGAKWTSAPRRPNRIKHHKRVKTPNWKSRGHTLACPRDCFLVIGDEIIEAPMSWRNRYFEREAYYEIFKEYFDQGAKWTSAPRPLLKDSLYNKKYKVPASLNEMEYVINESEIVFDAADFVRAGKDIFVTMGNVTNEEGIKWLERHLGDKYKIHRIPTKSHQPMHIDTTLIPMGPKKILINPKYIDINELPPIFDDYEILVAPEPLLVDGGLFNENATMCSTWLNMNILLIDKERVLVEKTQIPMIEALKKWGFKPIPCSLIALGAFGGAFHCVTLDIRRSSKLETY